MTAQPILGALAFAIAAAIVSAVNYFGRRQMWEIGDRWCVKMSERHPHSSPKVFRRTEKGIMLFHAAITMLIALVGCCALLFAAWVAFLALTGQS